MMSKSTSRTVLAPGQVKEVTWRRGLFMQRLKKDEGIWDDQLRTNKHRTVRTRVGSKYGAGEDGDMIWVIYSGEVGALIGWNGDAVGIGGENEGLGCS